MNYNLMPFKYFVDVVQTQGFNSAAKRNYVSETAISNAISKLEQQIGHRLINRSSGNLTLTTYGQGFYQRAVALLYSYNELLMSFGIISIAIRPAIYEFTFYKAWLGRPKNWLTTCRINITSPLTRSPLPTVSND